MRWIVGISGASVLLLCAVACGDDGADPPPKGCTVKDQFGCSGGQVCEEVEGAAPACFDPVVVAGSITDIGNAKPLLDARIVALDENGVALSIYNLSNTDGTYHLPVPAKRDASGAPLPGTFTLHVEAADYQAFPTAPRFAPILDVKDAKNVGDESPEYVLQAPNTDVALLRLRSTIGLGSISGNVVTDEPGGTLVVVNGKTGVADRDGKFVVYNLDPGNAKVNAYKAGLNFDVTTTTIMAAGETKGVVLNGNMQPTGSVTGNIQIVGVAGMTTTVALALEDTFDQALVRGAVPPGLRAVNTSGAFAIGGVPNGKYVILTSFDNDGLVHDPDTTGAGTPLVTVTVQGGGDQNVQQTLKVERALGVVSPGGTQVDTVGGNPKFVWDAATGNDSYHVELLDGFGVKVWELVGAFDMPGMPATVDYAGPALESGMLYQFRATALVAGTPLTSTEDLRGAFVYQ